MQIDVDPNRIGMRYPFEVNLLGDAESTLRALLPLLHRGQDCTWREDVERNVRDWWAVLQRRAHVTADPVNPELVFHELSPQLPDNAILTSDSGSVANWYARNLKIRSGMRVSLSGTLAMMGLGMPYATGAKFAHPGRPVIALVGDGAMQMNGINELITLAQHWREQSDPRGVVAVLNNGDLNQVTWEMRAMSGAPQFIPSQRIPQVDHAAMAGQLGLRAEWSDDPAQVGDAWRRALATERPRVLEFIADPAVPPIPPRADLDQLEKVANSLPKGIRRPGRWSAKEYLLKGRGSV
ncbi:thiamine pyrophosphate-dependent enzyme [Saccharopolyspora rectivirgula]|uniref:thiamine pyrophosphate-dependent enzyme n=1 Tax=Saccharopolyspora rectivirgula TaxID=28042 RepID=UPI00041BE277|nr:thiamine pyrophosphate-dependent enzyme [Saccharopolyspora rectivirgula]